MKTSFIIKESFKEVLTNCQGVGANFFSTLENKDELIRPCDSAEWSLYESDPEEDTPCNSPAYVTKEGELLFIETATSKATYTIRPLSSGEKGCTVTYSGPYRGLLEQYLLPKMTPVFAKIALVLHSNGISTLQEYWDSRDGKHTLDNGGRPMKNTDHPTCLEGGISEHKSSYFTYREIDLSKHSFEDALLWALAEPQVEAASNGCILNTCNETFSVKKTETDVFFYFTSYKGGAYLIEKSTMKLYFWGSEFELYKSNWGYTPRTGIGFPIFDLGLE